jgi:pimeloyl-ACP methyl ester carboxylesterase
MKNITAENGTINPAKTPISSIGSVITDIGCAALEKIVANTSIGKQIKSHIENNFIRGMETGYKITDFNLLSQPDLCRDRQILLFIHGFGCNVEEFLEEEKTKPASKLSVMKEVFGNRVLLANYPSNHKVEDIFSGLEQQFFDAVIDPYSRMNHGAKPNITIAGHSLGSQFTRMFARKHSQYVKKVALIAGINNGVNLIGSNSFFGTYLQREMEKILIQHNVQYSEEDYAIIAQLLTGSKFFKNLNSPTEPLDVVYDIFAARTKRGKGNNAIRGRNDFVVGFNEAFPYHLIKSGNFENVNIRNAVVVEGGNHSSIVDNLRIFGEIMCLLYSDNRQYAKTLPRPKYAHKIFAY